jgi:hypothetical protein
MNAARIEAEVRDHPITGDRDWDFRLRTGQPLTYQHIVREGREFTPMRRPKDFCKMKSGACFYNALVALQRRVIRDPECGLRYAEGFAQLTLSSGITWWVHHAWIVDLGDNAIDVTWQNAGLRYIGFVLDYRRAWDLATSRGPGVGPAFELWP